MTRFLASLMGALMLAATLLGGAPATAQQGEAPQVTLAPDMSMGDEAAPITIIEYASYTCPHCARFHEEVFPKLKEEYIDTGKVRFVHREVFFDRYGLWAALLSRCGDGTRYFGMNDLIYGTQRDWIGNGEPQQVLENLRKMGRLAGLEDEQISACLQDRDMAQSLVAAFQTHAEADGIDATPTFMIDGEKVPNQAWKDMKEIIDAKLAAKGQ